MLINKTYLKPCPKCPSMHYPDPESEDIMTWDHIPLEKRQFVCAWRRRGFCHGNSKQLRGFEPWREKKCYSFPCVQGECDDTLSFYNRKGKK